MKRSPTNEYLRTKVLTASPAELRLMLLDGAVRFAEQAQQGVLERNYERMFEGVTRAQAILVELLNGLDPRHDAELCQRLSGLYTYMYTRLVTASSTRDPSIFEEVCNLLRYERETWQMLMTKLASEQAEPPPADALASRAAHQAHERHNAAPPRRLSVQG
jgi:flagellar protein FliS